MKKWGANADPEEKAMFLNDLRKSAEEYVSVKREWRWDNDPNWKPTSPSGEKRFDAALAIIDLTRQQLGMSSFSIADHAVAIRRYEKQKYAPKDFDDAVRNSLKGRRDQFEVTKQTNKLTEDHERNEIAKLLNEGKPKTKDGVERVRQEIAHPAQSISLWAVIICVYRLFEKVPKYIPPSPRSSKTTSCSFSPYPAPTLLSCHRRHPAYPQTLSA